MYSYIWQVWWCIPTQRCKKCWTLNQDYKVVLYSYSEMIPFSIRAWIKSLHRLFICCSCFLEFEYWTKCFNNCNFDFFVSDKSRVLTLLALDLILSHGQLPFLESKQCLIFLQIFLPIFSVPKWKTSCSQPELLLQDIFIVKKLLVDWASLTILVLKIRRNN